MKKIVVVGLLLGVMSMTLSAKKGKEVAKAVASVVTKAIVGDTKKKTKVTQAIGTITTQADFEAKIKEGNFTVVKFHAPWCSFCVKMTPVFEAVAEKYKESYSFYEINTDNAREVATKNGVRSIPLFRFFDKEGNKLGEFTGYVDQSSFEEKMKKLFGAN